MVVSCAVLLCCVNWDSAMAMPTVGTELHDDQATVGTELGMLTCPCPAL